MDHCTTCFAKESDFVTREIAGETIIVPIRNNVGDLNAIYTLNEVGTAIWQQIDGQKTIDHVVNAICSEYEVTAGQAKQDILEFLNELENAGLVRLLDKDVETQDEGPQETKCSNDMNSSGLLEFSF